MALPVGPLVSVPEAEGMSRLVGHDVFLKTSEIASGRNRKVSFELAWLRFGTRRITEG